MNLTDKLNDTSKTAEVPVSPVHLGKNTKPSQAVVKGGIKSIQASGIVFVVIFTAIILSNILLQSLVILYSL